MVKKHGVKLEDNDWTEISIKVFSVEFYPGMGDDMSLKAIIHFDPNTWFLPRAFYKFVARQVADIFFKKLFRLSKNAHNESWGEKMKDNEHFYDWLREIVNGYKGYLELKYKEGVGN